MLQVILFVMMLITFLAVFDGEEGNIVYASLTSVIIALLVILQLLG